MLHKDSSKASFDWDFSDADSPQASNLHVNDKSNYEQMQEHDAGLTFRLDLDNALPSQSYETPASYAKMQRAATVPPDVEASSDVSVNVNPTRYS